jgi:hypothetical protein
MAFEHKENTGTLSVNKWKKEGSKQPDYKGKLNIEGKMYVLSGWENKGNYGPWWSLKVESEESRKQYAQQPREETSSSPVHDIDDSIPF